MNMNMGMGMGMGGMGFGGGMPSMGGVDMSWGGFPNTAPGAGLMRMGPSIPGQPQSHPGVDPPQRRHPGQGRGGSGPPDGRQWS